MASRIKPLLDRVLVRRIQAQKRTTGGIVLPESAQEKSHEGEVLAVGPGALTSSGEHIKPAVEVGDRVLLQEYGGTEFKFHGDEVTLFREEDILAIVAPEK